ncbi:hypothetical protein GQ600_11389 [Phytophthora cactorum]|nr:hypothetical protein GQ600_11389 [Phytophthora cactorum]
MPKGRTRINGPGGSRSSTAAQPSLTTRNWRLSIGSENTYTIHP